MQHAVSIIRTALVALMLVGATSPVHAMERTSNIVALLKVPGHIAFKRHAWAPFEGAPQGTEITAETLGPSETQRNLDDKGRQQARDLGALFKREGVVFDHIHTSKWCRCQETADLIAGRPVEVLPVINSYWTHPDKATVGPRQQAALKRYLNETLPRDARALMVTHGSLITDLTGIDTDETEIVIVKADGKGGVVVVARGVP
jgi:broad specificity phosphatase PhoE